MAKLIIDREKCIKCGTCAAVYPNYFEAKDDHFEARNIEVSEKEAQEMARICPVGAISVVKD
jgi:ferredoxin